MYWGINKITMNKRQNLMNRKGWLDFRIGKKDDRRRKLTDEQKEEIYHIYHTENIGMRPLAKEYGVNRTTIRNIVKPEKYKWMLSERKRNQTWKKYYDTDKQREYMRSHRGYIRQLFKKRNTP